MDIIPNEILNYIFGFVSGYQLNTMLVCKKWLKIFQDHFLKAVQSYKITKPLNGFFTFRIGTASGFQKGSFVETLTFTCTILNMEFAICAYKKVYMKGSWRIRQEHSGKFVNTDYIINDWNLFENLRSLKIEYTENESNLSIKIWPDAYIVCNDIANNKKWPILNRVMPMISHLTSGKCNLLKKNIGYRS